jgi:tRNA (cytidine/uridine-2'-O-)-methyltransferase
MIEKKFSIVLFSPEIPGNTGSIGRTCVALNLNLILIKPYGFDLSEKSVRRAGLDYWKHVHLKEFESWQHFIQSESPKKEELIFFSKTGAELVYNAPFKENCFLIFGSETKGLPQEILNNFSKNIYKLPMFSEKVRSLNLANTATTVSYECLRQLNL